MFEIVPIKGIRVREDSNRFFEAHGVLLKIACCLRSVPREDIYVYTLILTVRQVATAAATLRRRLPPLAIGIRGADPGGGAHSEADKGAGPLVGIVAARGAEHSRGVEGQEHE